MAKMMEEWPDQLSSAERVSRNMKTYFDGAVWKFTIDDASKFGYQFDQRNQGQDALLWMLRRMRQVIGTETNKVHGSFMYRTVIDEKDQCFYYQFGAITCKKTGCTNTAVNNSPRCAEHRHTPSKPGRGFADVSPAPHKKRGF